MFPGEYNPEKEQDALSVGKLSVVSEHSEEEYQRTIQSVHAQKELLDGLNTLRQGNNVSVVDEENSGMDTTTPKEEGEKPIEAAESNNWTFESTSYRSHHFFRPL